MELTAVLTPAEEGGFIALNPETGTTTQGETIEEAVANLREATVLYLSEFPLLKTSHPVVTHLHGRCTCLSCPAFQGRQCGTRKTRLCEDPAKWQPRDHAQRAAWLCRSDA